MSANIGGKVKRDKIFDLLKQAGALYTDGHFELTSEMHAGTYADFRVFLDEKREPELVRLCSALAELFRHDKRIDVVVGPQRGGARIAEFVSRFLQVIQGRDVPSVTAYARVVDGKKRFFISEVDRRSLKGKRVLFTDDVLSMGTTFRLVRNVLSTCGAEIIALGVFLNRGGLKARDLRVRHLGALASMTFEVMTAAECAERGPCSRNVPISLDLGHGRRSAETIMRPPPSATLAGTPEGKCLESISAIAKKNGGRR